MPFKRSKCRSGRLALAIACSLCGLAAATGAELVEVKQTAGKAVVTVGGRPFAEYLAKSGPQPVIWPIVGPGGTEATRRFPMASAEPGERADHPNHRSLWFSHGSVNGLDFWLPPIRTADGKDNQIVHRDFKKVESDGNVACVVTVNEWLSNGQKVCEDERTCKFYFDDRGRWIDFAIEVKATEGDLTFGDTEEGTLGIRVPHSMTVNANQGGGILASGGKTDKDAWGQAGTWVDFHGPIEGKPAGVAMFCMSDNFRYPCRWHIRPYGLFAANPFGENGFPPADIKQGSVTVAKGDTLHIHYKILFYDGQFTAGELQSIEESFAGGTR